ncbi:hypothetical protein O2N63_09815 [Aliiroseovarius sp. KMU-50]|uniref:Lipoprotein n=1 Tax=Aliiroseovarius salicola TaxID=3009082 RepID=A0ABT4W1J4_9RHOB|nr:hypothetical protein [Aliiroseovarius sp. KMU-50]MDA5094380.1 hypothetical protein [Aliiroseovarius sp. KMU-50]
MKISSLVFAAMAAGVLTGCAGKASFESNPVQIETPNGVVVCQLYTRDRVQWDEAIAVPSGMTKAEGDAYCVQEGYRQYSEAHDKVRTYNGS